MLIGMLLDPFLGMTHIINKCYSRLLIKTLFHLIIHNLDCLIRWGTDRRMILDFGTDLDAKRGLFIKPYPGESSDYGYGAGGVLQTRTAYGAHHELINNEVKLNNVARHLDADTNLYELRVKIQTKPIL